MGPVGARQGSLLGLCRGITRRATTLEAAQAACEDTGTAAASFRVSRSDGAVAFHPALVEVAMVFERWRSTAEGYDGLPS